MKRFLLPLTIGLLSFAPASPAALAQESGYVQSFDGGTAWLDSKPLTAQDLQNKVVLVEFWDYSLLNSLHTIPYLKEWYKRYASDGLLIVGVQSPVLSVSGNPEYVGEVMRKLGITWPVVVDGKHAIATRFGATDTPHFLLYDRNGFRIANVSGEMNYPALEAEIQLMLKGADPNLQLPPPMALLPQDSYDQANALAYPKTTDIFVQNRGAIANEPSNTFGDNVDYYDVKPPHADGKLYLQGSWRRSGAGIVAGSAIGYVALHYHAIEVAALMSAPAGKSIDVVVTQNGQPVEKADAGSDIQYDTDGRSYVSVDIPRAYDLIENKHWGSYDLRLYPKSQDLSLYELSFESAQTGADY